MDPESAVERPTYETVILTERNWLHWKDKIAQLLAHTFQEYSRDYWEGFVRTNLLKSTLKPKWTTVLLHDANDLVGCTIAWYPMAAQPDAAYVPYTAIREGHRNRKLVGLLMLVLEDQLRSQGATYMVRDARIEGGYASAIRRHYGDRIVEEEEEGPHVPKRRCHFKIRL